MKAIKAKEAKKLIKKLGLEVPEKDGATFYATDDKETEVWDFETKKERDLFVEASNEKEVEQEVRDHYKEDWEDEMVTRAEYEAEIHNELVDMPGADRLEELKNEYTSEDNAERFEKILKDYNKLMYGLGLGYKTFLTESSEIKEEWTGADMIAEADYELGTYYEEGHMNYDLWRESAETRKLWINETNRLKRFIKKWIPEYEGWTPNEKHCSGHYDNGITEYKKYA